MNKLASIGILAVLLQGCAKELTNGTNVTTTKQGNYVTITELAGKQEAWKSIFAPTSGSFLVSSCEGYNILKKGIVSNTAAQGRIVDPKQERLISFRRLTINDLPLDPITEKEEQILEVHPAIGSELSQQLSKCFGQTNKIELQKQGGDVSCELPFPAALQLANFNELTKDGFLHVKKGEPITLKWNASPENELGLYIKLADQENYETGMPIYLFIAQDDGSFTISSEILAQYYTEKASVSAQIIVYRGSFKDITADVDYRFASLSQSTLNIIFEK